MAIPIIYLIRHGEKPPKNPDGSDQDGLSTMGVQRAQGLRITFGPASPYNIKHIIAQHPKKDGGRARPYETILPLSVELGIKPDKSIDRDDAKGAAEAAKSFQGPGNVLLCWEHGVLSDIVQELGVSEPATYPNRFDMIWAVRSPYDILEWVGSEHVAGLDDRENAGDGQFGAIPSTATGGVGVVPLKAPADVTVAVDEVPIESNDWQ